MSGDYKYEMQLIAEDLAYEEFDTYFYDLSDAQQNALFLRAERRWMDARCDAADAARKAMRERRI